MKIVKYFICTIIIILILGVTGLDITSSHDFSMWKSPSDVIIGLRAYADITSTYDFKSRKNFYDLPDSHWAYDEIASLSANGLMGGYPDGSFNPDGIITRAEASKILASYMKRSNTGYYDFSYNDVFPGVWYYDYSYAAFDLLPELYDMDGNRCFMGNQALSRSEAIYALVNIKYAADEIPYCDYSVLLPYTDNISIAEKFRPYVAVALEKGLISGYDDMTLRMNYPVTRAEFAALIYRGVDARLSAHIDGISARIAQPYDYNTKLGINFTRRGPNNIPDFTHWYIIPDTMYAGNLDFQTPVKTACTDSFSPYIVYAVSNADGDMPDSMNFTGGNHRYDDALNDGSPTARNESLKFSVNGIPTTSYIGDATYIDISYTNYIQATNTKKYDGSGRAVLKETNRIHVDGDKWKFSVEIEALEDVNIVRYYGPQFDLLDFANTVTYVYDSDMTESYPISSDSQSSTSYCSKMILTGGILNTEILVDAQIPRNHNSTNHSAFYRSYGKTYFNVINSVQNPLSLKKGEKITVNGYYKFKNM